MLLESFHNKYGKIQQPELYSPCCKLYFYTKFELSQTTVSIHVFLASICLTKRLTPGLYSSGPSYLYWGVFRCLTVPKKHNIQNKLGCKLLSDIRQHPTKLAISEKMITLSHSKKKLSDCFFL